VGLRTRQSKVAEALAIMPDAIQLVAERWREPRDQLSNSAMPLERTVAAFCIPMYAELRRTFPALRGAPDPFLLIVVAKGIEHSGTHSAEELCEAIDLPPLPF
jgi:hypothetical protein